MNTTAAAPVVGVDLAQNVFQLAVADAHWRVVSTHRLTRSQFVGRRLMSSQFDPLEKLGIDRHHHCAR